MHDVVAAPVAQQVPEHAQRRRPAAAGCAGARPRCTGAIRGPAATHPHARPSVGALAARPLAQRQVGDLVALGGKPLGEVAVPALGAADGVRVTGSRRRGRSRIPLASHPVGRGHPRAPLSARSGVITHGAGRAAERHWSSEPPMSTLAHTSDRPARRPTQQAAPLVSVVIPCLNEAENIESCVARGARGHRARWASPARWSSPTTTPRTTPRASPSGRRARGRRTPPRLRQRLPRRLRRLARPLHRDGRRRPHLRLRRDPPLRGRARGRAPRW